MVHSGVVIFTISSVTAGRFAVWNSAGAFLYEVCMLSLCLCWFSLGNPSFVYSTKTVMLTVDSEWIVSVMTVSTGYIVVAEKGAILSLCEVELFFQRYRQEGEKNYQFSKHRVCAGVTKKIFLFGTTGISSWPWQWKVRAMKSHCHSMGFKQSRFVNACIAVAILPSANTAKVRLEC